MYRISGKLQQYAWGIPGGLAAWHDGKSGGPEAELWFGAHLNGPSPLVDSPDKTLADVAGVENVPLLVKLLAADRPLSIQIHPPTDQAEARFAQQQADPSLEKLLADPLAKTEMLIALYPFSILQGLREPSLAIGILDGLGGTAAEAASLLGSGDVKGAIRILLGMSAEELVDLDERLPAVAAAAGLDPSGIEALTIVARDYPGDPGVLVASIMGQLVMSEGEAVYVEAGVVHAYITGIGVEVMTASDNVLRLGLTPKVVAVDEALEALQPQLLPQLMQPGPQLLANGGSLRSYEPHDAPFDVQWLHSGTATYPSGHYRLVLCVSGSTTVTGGGESLTLAPGQAAAVLAAEPEVEVSATASAFTARSAN